jgi:hypothetical protein
MASPPSAVAPILLNPRCWKYWRLYLELADKALC